MKLSPYNIAYALHDSLIAAPQDQWDAIVDRFFQYLLSIGKGQWIKQILAIVEQREHARSGTEKVTVTVAHKGVDAHVQSLIDQLVGDKQAEITVQEDPAILGGARIETANQRWDLSLQKQLQTLESILINE